MYIYIIYVSQTTVSISYCNVWKENLQMITNVSNYVLFCYRTFCSSNVLLPGYSVAGIFCCRDIVSGERCTVRVPDYLISGTNEKTLKIVHIWYTLSCQHFLVKKVTSYLPLFTFFCSCASTLKVFKSGGALHFL